MTNRILLVFEGAVTEKAVWASLNRFYLNDQSSPVVIGIYGGEIYSLYHRMEKDTDLELFSLLKQDPRNAGLLDNVAKDQVSEIYLFFDYDGHAAGATDEKLLSMLEFFNEETENGKLYISYPMVESLRHLHPEVPFQGVLSRCKENIRYKGVVHAESSAAYRNVSHYTSAQWAHVITEHCKKLNMLMNDVFEFPATYYGPSDVFGKQIEKHIKSSQMVAVLSAFPVFLLDYYGCSSFERLLNGDG